MDLFPDLLNRRNSLELGAAGVTGVGDRVPDVLNRRDVAHKPLETKTVPSMRDRTILAKVEVPPVQRAEIRGQDFRL